MSAAAQVTQSAIELIVLPAATTQADITQSAVELVMLYESTAQVTQSAIELIILPGTKPKLPTPPPPTAGSQPPFSPRCCLHNVYDCCLESIAEKLRKIKFPCLCIMPPGFAEQEPTQREHDGEGLDNAQRLTGQGQGYDPIT